MQYGGEYMKKHSKAEGPVHEKGESEDVKMAEYGAPDTSGFLSRIMDTDKKSGETE
jgi:hypothetical protein